MSTVTGSRTMRLYGLLDWPARLAAVNLLWLAGVLAGLIVAGAAPATAAAYWLLREYALGRSPRLWRDFWLQWRARLRSAQVSLGLPLATIVPLTFYAVAATRSGSGAVQGLGAGLAVLTAGYAATLLYLPAVLVHYELPPAAAWRVAAAAAWRQPAVTLAVALGSAAGVAAMVLLVPGALLFLAASGPALAAVKAALRGFKLLS